MHSKSFVSITFFCLFFIEVANGQIIRFRLEATDLAGSVMSTIGLGESFLLNSYALDLRTEDQCDLGCGLFAGYLDVTYDSELAEVGGEITYGDDYQNGLSADLAIPGLLDNIGAFTSSFTPIGLDERMLFSVPMKATSLGALTFEGGPANSTPQHHVLLFGIDSPITDIEFGLARLQVVPEPSGGLLLLVGLAAWSLRTSRFGRSQK